MPQPLTDFLDRLGPQPWWQALQVLTASLVLAFLLRWILTRIVPQLTSRTRTGVDDEVIRYLRTPVFVSVLLFGASVALALSELREPYPRHALSAIKTLAVLVWVVFASRVAKLVLQALSRHHERFRFIQPQTLPVLSNVSTAVVFGGAVYFLLLAWDVDVSAWVASAGILGLAASLAARDTLANLFAGLSILADTPFKVGDFIVLESGERGEVTRIGLRSSRILTRDDIEIIVPNSVLANTKIVNEAGGGDPRHRVRLQVQVAYGSDVDQVRRVLLEVAAAEPKVCHDPEPRVRFRAFADSGLAVELLTWVPEPWMRGQALDAMICAVYQRFCAEGIEIPFPQRVVHLARKEKVAPAAAERIED